MASTEHNQVNDQPTGTNHDELVDSSEQPFLDHVIELRARILRGLIIVILLFCPIYFYANELYTLVAAPLMAASPCGHAIPVTTSGAAERTNGTGS